MSKIQFFNFPGRETVKQNQKFKNNSKPSNIVSQSTLR